VRRILSRPDRRVKKNRASRREVTREECQPLAIGRPDLREVAQAAGYVLDLRSAAMVH
jgi:hypothetical protein